MIAGDLTDLEAYSDDGSVVLSLESEIDEFAVRATPMFARAIAVKLMLCADEAEGVGAS